MTDSLRKSAQTLLTCADDFAMMKQSVDSLYQLFSNITQVNAFNLNQDKDIMLPSGKAISTLAAAHCLLEMKRTAVFLRGIHKAIQHKLKENKEKPVHILYAGTGPYGTLIIPLLPLFSTEEIQVDLLDINPASLEAIQKLTDTLKLNDYIGSVYCSDATTFTVNQKYDIAISETMLACLKNEPQVAVMQNLIPQLKPDTIFIPEEISIDAALTNSKMEQDRLLYYEDEPPPFRRIELGNVFTVSKQNMDSVLLKKTVSIPDEATIAFPILKLFTNVRVFDNEVLTDNDSSITIPKQFYNFRVEKYREVEFRYIQGEKPRIESSVVQPVFIH